EPSALIGSTQSTHTTRSTAPATWPERPVVGAFREDRFISIPRVQTEPATTLRRTPLYEQHVALGARMVSFAGWEMPVQYEGVVTEHVAVREDCGVFDVSHMGELELEGPRAGELLQSLLSNDLDRIGPGR